MEQQISYIQIELGCKAFGIPESAREAIILYNFDEGVPPSEQTDLMQLSKMSIKEIQVRSGLRKNEWVDILPVLTKQELTAITNSMMQDLMDHKGNQPSH